MRPELAHLLLPVLFCAPACAAPVRPTISLDGEWSITIPGKASAYKISVPGSWQAQIPELRDYAGKATYTKTVSVPESWKGKRVLVHFGAVDYLAEVYVNGAKAGSHEGGYTPFEFSIEDHLKFGSPNEIRVEVADPGPGHPVEGIKFGEIPHGKQSWYGNASGLWQSARLEARPAVYIDRIIVDPHIDSSSATVRIELAGSGKCSVRLSIDPPKGGATAPGVTMDVTEGHKDATWDVEIPGAKLWSPDTPALYTVKAELIVDGEAVDALSTHFGMRKIEAKDGKILLNNEPIFVAAALDQDFYPITEYSTQSDAFVKDQFLKAKHLGLNMLRCHIKVPDPKYLEWADRLGLLVWYEIPNWDNLTEDAKRRGKDTLTEMLRRDHNHPSLVIVSIINEAWGVDVKSADHRKWMADMYDHAKSLEPGRLIVDNSACGKNFHVKTDIEDFHVYYQIPDQARDYDKWIADFSKHPDWTFASTPDKQRRGFEPLMLSEFGNWGLPRLSNLKKCYGGEEPWWFGTRRGSSNDATIAAGAQERFTAHYLDKAFGTIDGLADAFQDQEWLALKYQIEELRKYPSIVGYVITEFTDLHWESNGLLDYCRNPKTFHDVMHTVQEQDIVFARADRANFTSGEEVALDVWLSHFSQLDMSKCKVKWSVGSSLRGELPVEAMHAPDARRIGKIAISAPDVASPKPMRLELSLVGETGKVLVSNYESFNVFPAKGPEMPSNVIVSAKLDPETVRRIKDGGVAVICFESPKDAPALGGGLKVVDRGKAGRWGAWCNCLTWFRECPAFAGAVVPKTVDFSFEEMIPNCVIDGIDRKHWESDVLSGIFVGWVNSQAAMVAQVKCGKGRAILTTFPLVSASKTNPMARFLLASLARYVASDECKPSLECNLDASD